MKRCIVLIVLLLSAGALWGQEAASEITPEATALPLGSRFPDMSNEFTFLVPVDWLVVQLHSFDYNNAPYLYSVALHNTFRILGKESLDAYMGFAVYDSGEVSVQIRLRACDTDLGGEELIIEDFYALTPNPAAPPQMVEHIMVGDQSAVSTRLDIINGDGMLVLLPIKRDRVCVLVHLRTAAGELSQWEPTALAIAETIQIPPAILARG